MRRASGTLVSQSDRWSSSDSLPSWLSSRTTAATKVLVTLPISNGVSSRTGATGSPLCRSRLALPVTPSHRSSGVATAAEIPGTPSLGRAASMTSWSRRSSVGPMAASVAPVLDCAATGALIGLEPATSMIAATSSAARWLTRSPVDAIRPRYTTESFGC